MKTNFNQRERFFRFVLAIMTGGLGVSGYFDDSLLNFALLGLGGVILCTTLANFCPIYRFLGVSTNKSRRMTY
jgi:hypothetical protein